MVLLQAATPGTFFKATNSDPHDLFGFSVATARTTLLVGAPAEASAAQGVDGDSSSNAAPHSGAAHVFTRSSGAWSPSAYLKASNSAPFARFGWCVAASESTLVVGAPNEAGAATGVDGDQAAQFAPGAGAAYVFEPSGPSWTQSAYLKASNTGAGDRFGESLALSSQYLAVGAPGESSGSSGVNGDQTSDDAQGSGAVYVFERAGSSWVQTAYVKASPVGVGNANDQFGMSVALEGGLLVVGAPYEDGNGIHPSDDSVTQAGCAYVFRKVQGTWVQEAYLKAPSPGSNAYFGHAVAVRGSRVFIGAPGAGTGEVYVFSRSTGEWALHETLRPVPGDAGDLFGVSLTAHDHALVVGASSEDGAGGSQLDDSSPKAGAAYLLVESEAGWHLASYLKASNPGTEDHFGFALALGGGSLAVGAPREDSGSSGVNGFQDDGRLDSGAAYGFELEIGEPSCDGVPPSACPCGNEADGTEGVAGCANSVDPAGARLRAIGSAEVGLEALVLVSRGLPPGQPCLFLQGTAEAPATFAGDGLNCLGSGQTGLTVRLAAPDGTAQTGGPPLSSLVAPGQVVTYQALYRDPQTSPCGSGLNLTNTLRVRWEP